MGNEGEEGIRRKGVGLVSRSVDLVDDVDNLRVRTSALGTERFANLQFKSILN